MAEPTEQALAVPADQASPAAKPAHAPRTSGHAGYASLSEIHRTVAIPLNRPWWRRLFAFAGPAYMVSVGYMDPGNWATDLEGGARFGYSLLWVLLMSNLMAVLLQTLSARLGLATGRDLAQACRDDYPPFIRYTLFGLCEIAIVACDLAEVLGTAIGLNLLLGIPILPAVIITAFDVILLLAIQRLGVRKMEAFILTLISTIGLCFIVELFLSKPSPSGIASGLVPSGLSHSQLYVAIGILGATVMPHNLYLHSSLVQSRAVRRDRAGIAQACRYNLVDSAIALNAAFFVNAAILILAASTFFRHGIEVTEIEQAHQLLDDILGSNIAPIAFAVALICAGQSSTLTGTLAGQITMEGFLRLRMRPWLRRLITRSMAIVPAVAVIAIMGDRGTYSLLILSQVVLSLQLPFAVIPLVRFTSSRVKMGPFANPLWVKTLAWLVASLIVALNVKLVYGELTAWIADAEGYRWVLLGTVVPIALGLMGLLLWLIFKPGSKQAAAPQASAEQVAQQAVHGGRRLHRIGVALEAKDTDSAMLGEAIALARANHAELILLHVVEGVGGQWYGRHADDEESRHDEDYLHRLAQHLNAQPDNADLPPVKLALGHGRVVAELVRLADEHHLDMLVVGGHGHRGIADLLHGQTIPGVRHGLALPILAVRR
jgi:manganese transport protein